jgi:lipoprotein NlpI
LDGVIADYTKYIELKPDDADAYVNRSFAKQAKGDSDGAIADCTKAIGLKPDDADGYNNRGIAKKAKGDLDGAIADYTKAIELKPDDADAYNNRAIAKKAKGDLDGAIADYTKYIELKPDDADAYHRRGCLRYDRRAWTEALVDFTKEAELDAANDYAQFRLWLLRTRLGESESANQKLQSYLATRKPLKAPDWALTVNRYLVGQLTEPEFLAAAKTADPKTEAGQLCEAYFYAGSKHLFAGDKAAATDYFQKSIATGKTTYTEYSSAAAELKFLKAQ